MLNNNGTTTKWPRWVDCSCGRKEVAFAFRRFYCRFMSSPLRSELLDKIRKHFFQWDLT